MHSFLSRVHLSYDSPRRSFNACEDLLVRVSSTVAYDLLQIASIICNYVMIVILLLLMQKIIVTSRWVGFHWPVTSILVTVFLPNLRPSTRFLDADPVVLIVMLVMVMVYRYITARLDLQSRPHIRSYFLARIAWALPPPASATGALYLHLLIL